MVNREHTTAIISTIILAIAYLALLQVILLSIGSPLTTGGWASWLLEEILGVFESIAFK